MNSAPAVASFLLIVMTDGLQEEVFMRGRRGGLEKGRPKAALFAIRD